MYNKIFDNRTALKNAYFLAINNYCDFDIFCDNLAYELCKNEKITAVYGNNLQTTQNRIININDVI